MYRPGIQIHMHATPATTRGVSLLLQIPHAAQWVTACDLKDNITAPGTVDAQNVSPKSELPEESEEPKEATGLPNNPDPKGEADDEAPCAVEL